MLELAGVSTGIVSFDHPGAAGRWIRLSFVVVVVVVVLVGAALVLLPLGERLFEEQGDVLAGRDLDVGVRTLELVHQRVHGDRTLLFQVVDLCGEESPFLQGGGDHRSQIGRPHAISIRPDDLEQKVHDGKDLGRARATVERDNAECVEGGRLDHRRITIGDGLLQSLSGRVIDGIRRMTDRDQAKR